MPRAKILGFLIVAAAAALMASAVEHSTPRHKLKKRKPIMAIPAEPPFVPEFDWEQEEYLIAHNELRREEGVAPLRWSALLTAQAHAWARQRRVDCNYRQHSSNQYGENIFWMSYKEYTPREVVQWWYGEKMLYDNSTYECRCQPERAGCECGHYLNVIWSTTRRLGCSGATYCDNQKGIYVVCQYDPPGLIPGINPFTGLLLP